MCVFALAGPASDELRGETWPSNGGIDVSIARAYADMCRAAGGISDSEAFLTERRAEATSLLKEPTAKRLVAALSAKLLTHRTLEYGAAIPILRAEALGN